MPAVINDLSRHLVATLKARPWRVYAFALAVTGAALLGRWGMGIAFGDRPWLILLLLPIILNAYIGGLGPGLLSTALIAAFAKAFLFPPFHSPAFAHLHDLAQWLMFIGAGVVVSGLIEALHRSRRRLEALVEESRRSAEILRDREALLQQAVQVAELGVFHHDHVDDLLRLSPQMREICGKTDKATISGAEWMELIHPADRDAVATGIGRAHDPGGDGNFALEHRLVLPGGLLRWVSVHSQTFFREVNGVRCPLLTVGAVQDITERKRAEQALGESRARLAAILGSALDAIITTDADQRIILFNAAAERMFGYRAEEIIGEPLDRLIPERFRAAHRQQVHEFGESGTTRRVSGSAMEVTAVRAGGAEFPIDAAISRAEAGGQRLLTVMLREVTERKRMEAEHQRMEAERHARQVAEAAYRAKSDFLANMSHELRSPLNTILGFTRLMERDPTLPESAREDLGLVLKSGEHLHELINEVLDMSKLDAGRTTLNETDFDLDFLLDELKDTLTPAAIEKGLQLIFAPRHDVPACIRGDPLKLRQILINLISNAIKFTCLGSITVRVEALAPAVRGERHRLGFSVMDTGCGIARDELETLFQSFMQARAGREAREGTGLGLAISRGFVRLMGGDMQIESELGRGTTVSFDLPVQAAESMPIQEAVAARQLIGLAPGEPRYRILAVDDHAAARHLLVRLLSPLGFDVREAANGQEAIELSRQWQPDLIWMDMRMPVLDGREATRRIRAEPAVKRPVIIALTASSFEEERQDILAAGCDDMLRKPFPEADLFAALERHLGVRFVYQEAAPKPPAIPTAPASVSLPDAMRTRLEDAIAQLNPEKINQAVEAIKSIDPQFAQALAAWARDFQYDAILSLIKKPPQETEKPYVVKTRRPGPA